MDVEQASDWRLRGRSRTLPESREFNLFSKDLIIALDHGCTQCCFPPNCRPFSIIQSFHFYVWITICQTERLITIHTVLK